MDNPRECTRCRARAEEAQARGDFHPESDVGPWDAACPGCGHICGDPAGNPSDGVCSRCGPLSEVERAELVRYAKDSSPHTVVSKLWRRFLDLEEAAEAVSEAWGDIPPNCPAGSAIIGRLRSLLPDA